MKIQPYEFKDLKEPVKVEYKPMPQDFTIEACVRFVMGSFFSNDDLDYVEALNKWWSHDDASSILTWHDATGLIAWEAFEDYSADDLLNTVDNAIEELCVFVGFTRKQYHEWKQAQ